MAETSFYDFAKGLPKAELHVHIEGTLEPELKLALAKRNGIELPQKTVKEIRDTYKFVDLPSFLAVYYSGMSMLHTQEDFYDLMTEYLSRAKADGVKHAEIFFDPQAHTSRGVSFSTVIEGLSRAIQDFDGLDARLIMCFLRDFSKESARKTLIEAEPYKERILGLGLDSDEHHNPPLKFMQHFADGVAQGYRITVHCDEDQVDSIEHIKQALEVIEAERLDHGSTIVESADLVEYAKAKGIGFTACPISNGFVLPGRKAEEIHALLRQGVKVSFHSDDPAYFAGYIADNYHVLAREHGFTRDDLVLSARNSFEASWIDADAKAAYLKEIDKFVESFSK